MGCELLMCDILRSLFVPGTLSDVASSHCLAECDLVDGYGSDVLAIPRHTRALLPCVG